MKPNAISQVFKLLAALPMMAVIASLVSGVISGHVIESALGSIGYAVAAIVLFMIGLLTAPAKADGPGSPVPAPPVKPQLSPEEAAKLIGGPRRPAVKAETPATYKLD